MNSDEKKQTEAINLDLYYERLEDMASNSNDFAGLKNDDATINWIGTVNWIGT
jgi:hypothetical protein